MPREVAPADDTPGYTGLGWEAATSDGGDHVHVVPLNDQVEHLEDADGECICGPSIERVERDDGSDGWLFTHHSLDDRERDE